MTLMALDIDDEQLACVSHAPLLITHRTADEAAAQARRIHAGGPQSAAPFVDASAASLPISARLLRGRCEELLDGAAGGSLLFSGVESMPQEVQDQILELLAELESQRPPSAAVRLIAATTESLLDRIAARTFSVRLFYRLNVIHLVAESAD
jgi:DNA-binding NtrC family response regulator